MSRDKYLLEPHQDDGVAIKLGGGSDFKMGVIVSTDQCPRIKVRTLLYGKTDTLLMQSRNLGLLSGPDLDLWGPWAVQNVGAPLTKSFH